ncbi:MAG TPA: acetyl-CoA C-acyltransferase [Gammaproteobacteria bacterium]|nr:acetyl-CoA C-acyltransferase [Gammaproteobacteria bacterium]
MQQDDVVIVGMARTPVGDFMGELASVPATRLGAAAIEAAVARSGVEPQAIEAVTMGCVLPAGLGQAPARQAALYAGLPQAVHCQTINKMCGSGMQALILSHDALRLGTYAAAVAGGMESMSSAPYLLQKGRGGYRMGHDKIYDHMMLDGLEDVYGGKSMGVFAEATAERYGFSREDQDAFALESLQRARQAAERGHFKHDIVPVKAVIGRKEALIDSDQHPRSVDETRIPKLKPAFVEGGTVTAANSSAISDGAAALVLMSATEAARRGLKPLARIVAHAAHSHAPEWFTTAPVEAVDRLLKRAGWTTTDVDLFEINEAFAVVTMAAMRGLSISHAKVNVHGGACALGHPIGASGARIVISLLSALQIRGLRRGVAALCIGGGEAVALAVERLE